MNSGFSERGIGKVFLTPNEKKNTERITDVYKTIIISVLFDDYND